MSDRNSLATAVAMLAALGSGPPSVYPIRPVNLSSPARPWGAAPGKPGRSRKQRAKAKASRKARAKQRRNKR